MTVERDSPTSPARFVPPKFTNGPDILGLQNPAENSHGEDPRSAPQYNVQSVKGSPGWYIWWVNAHDLRGGVNKWQRGFWDEVHDYLVSGDLDTRYRQQASNPPLLQQDVGFQPGTGTLWTVHHVNVFGVLVVAVFSSSGAGLHLYREQDDGTFTVIGLVTADANHAIIGLSAINIGGVPYLAVHKLEAPTELISAINTGSPAYTSVGEMHTSRAFRIWGMVQVGLVDTDVLFKGRGFVDTSTDSFYTLPIGAAVTDAPTEQLTGLQVGGYAIGISGLGGGQVDTYWNMPPKDAPFGTAAVPGGFGTTLANAETYWGHVYRVTEDGLICDDITDRFGLDNIPYCILVDNKLVAAEDGNNGRVVWYDKRRKVICAPFGNYLPNSDVERHIVGLYKKKDDFYIDVNEIGAEGVTRNTVQYKMMYKWASDSWEIVQEYNTLSTTGIQSWMGTAGGLPVSQFTGNLINRTGIDASGIWWRQWQPNPAQNPYNERNTTDSTAGTGRPFAADASGTSPIFTLRGLPIGGKYLVGGFWGPPIGQIKDGGTGAFVEYTLGGKTATFNGKGRAGTRPYAAITAHTNWVPELQWTYSLTRQSSGTDATLKAMNLLPVMAWGYYYCPEEVNEIKGMPAPWS